MKLHKDIKIELAASTDKTREAICAPFLHIDSETSAANLVATDGRMMAIIPVELDRTQDGCIERSNDVAGYVPADALKASRKLATKNNPLTQIKLNGTAGLDNGAQYPRSDSKYPYTYPNWKQVVPAADRPVAFKIRLDAEMLYRLAQSIGCEQVELTFAPHHLTEPCQGSKGREIAQPILVTPFTLGKITPLAPAAKGILMPISFEK